MFDLFRKSVVFFLFVILFIFTKRICNINGIKHKCNNSFQFFGKQSAAKFTVKIRLYVLSFYFTYNLYYCCYFEKNILLHSSNICLS